MATQAQIEANRRNALLSTGPKSPPGKLNSRANSFKHGLSGDGVVIAPEHRAEALRRKAIWNEELRPASLAGLYALDRMVAMSLRIELCENELDALFVEQTTRDRLDWDHARRVEAQALAGQLARDPATVAARLQESKPGVELILDRWALLSKSLELGAWDDSDRAAALDLLGVPREFRKPGQTPLDAPEGSDASAHIRAAIDGEVARLGGRVAAVLVPLDDLARRHAESSLTVFRSKPAALILRYEREATRRFLAAMKAAHSSPEDVILTSFDPGPSFEPEPDPEPEVEAAPVDEPAAQAPGLGEDYWRRFEAMMRGSGMFDAPEPEAETVDATSIMAGPEPEPSRSRGPVLGAGSTLVNALAGDHLAPRPNRRDRRAEAARRRRA